MGFFIFGKAPTGPLQGFLPLADKEQVVYLAKRNALHKIQTAINLGVRYLIPAPQVSTV